MRRIRLIVTPERERARMERGVIGCRVELALRDGSVRAAEVTQPVGHPDNRMNDDELLTKMGELLGDRYAPDLPARLLAACEHLPEANTLNELFDVITQARA